MKPSEYIARRWDQIAKERRRENPHENPIMCELRAATQATAEALDLAGIELSVCVDCLKRLDVIAVQAVRSRGGELRRCPECAVRNMRAADPLVHIRAVHDSWPSTLCGLRIYDVTGPHNIEVTTDFNHPRLCPWCAERAAADVPQDEGG